MTLVILLELPLALAVCQLQVFFITPAQKLNKKYTNIFNINAEKLHKISHTQMHKRYTKLLLIQIRLAQQHQVCTHVRSSKPVKSIFFATTDILPQQAPLSIYVCYECYLFDSL